MNFAVERGIGSLTTDTTLLFYHKEYAAVQRYQKLRIFQAWEGRTMSMVILLDLRGTVATSLPQSPFGSFLLMQPVAAEILHEFLAYIAEHLRREGVEIIEVVHPSNIYGPFPEKEAFKFFHLQYQDLNQHLDLTTDLEAGLHPMQLRKLRAAAKNGLRCVEEGPEMVTEVHAFIARCREQSGLKVNISLDKLSALFKVFHERYRIFSAYIGTVRVAAAITCQVTPKVAYYYLPATDEAYKASSPMVSLLQFISHHYRSKGVGILDLGVSSVEGIKQEGLFTFKERMAGQLTYKSTYRLQL